MKFNLKYADILVGTVIKQNEDFPNLWGRFELVLSEKSLDDKIIIRLAEFIKLSIRESDLVEREHLDDVSKEFEQLNIDIEPYMDFIESEEWFLVDENGKENKILVPSFKSDNSILWRWGI